MVGLIDFVSEIGELSKEVLKASSYREKSSIIKNEKYDFRIWRRGVFINMFSKHPGNRPSGSLGIGREKI
jgi:hypothetical protein